MSEEKDARSKLNELIDNAPKEIIDGFVSKTGKPSPEAIKIQAEFKSQVKELLAQLAKSKNTANDDDGNNNNDPLSYKGIMRTLRERSGLKKQKTEESAKPTADDRNQKKERKTTTDNDNEEDGFIFGAIVGDVCGSTYEKNNCKDERRVRLFRKGSKCTDDSVLTLATARRFLTEEDKDVDVDALYTRCYLEAGRKNPRHGYGGNFRRWLRSPDPKPYSSWGNGSAMRVSPVAWAVPVMLDDENDNNDGLARVLREAASSAAVTHDHPEGIKGAQVVAAAIYLARCGKTKDEIKNHIQTNFGYEFTRTLDDIRPGYGFDVSCQGSVPEALTAFFESRNFRDAVVKAISLGGDSDTIACIAGAVAQAYYGTVPKDLVRTTKALMKKDFLDTMDDFRRKYRHNLPDRNDYEKMPAAEERNHDDRPAEILPLVDIGINITHNALFPRWKDVVRRAVSAGVETMILTGTNLETSRENLRIAREWNDENDKSTTSRNLLCTVGVHPHEARCDFPTMDDGDSTAVTEMRRLIDTEDDGVIVAIGECGLDFERNFSPKETQLRAFREQVELAYDLEGKYPLFVHERKAHVDLVKVLDEVRAGRPNAPEPNVVIHCFTGTLKEAQEYVNRGYYIGLTGFICKPERGEKLRDTVVPELPLDRIMVETDAPWMAFPIRELATNGRRRKFSEPADVVYVVKTLSDILGKDYREVCRAVTDNTRRFFGLRRFRFQGGRSDLYRIVNDNNNNNNNSDNQ